MRRPRKPIPPPLEANTLRVTLIGTACWAVAALVLGIAYPWLADHDHTWLLWTCLAGVVLGLIGTAYALRMRNRRSPLNDSGVTASTPVDSAVLYDNSGTN